MWIAITSRVCGCGGLLVCITVRCVYRDGSLFVSFCADVLTCAACLMDRCACSTGRQIFKLHQRLRAWVNVASGTYELMSFSFSPSLSRTSSFSIPFLSKQRMPCVVAWRVTTVPIVRIPTPLRAADGISTESNASTDAYPRACCLVSTDTNTDTDTGVH